MWNQDALLRAVLAAPEPDAPRRAYADAAMANGDIRGAFVDLQLKLADKFRRNARIADWTPMYRESEAMLATYVFTWRRPLEDLLNDQVIAEPTFMRGFVEHIEMSARAFVDHAPAVFALAPILHVTLVDVKACLDALTSPHLARIVSLVLPSAQLGDDPIEILARSPHVSRLRWLDVSANRITARGLDAICSSPYLKELRYVNFRGNQIDDPTDDAGFEGEALIETYPSNTGMELERRHGPIRWLHGPNTFGDAFPPLRDAVEPA